MVTKVELGSRFAFLGLSCIFFRFRRCLLPVIERLPRRLECSLTQRHTNGPGPGKQDELVAVKGTRGKKEKEYRQCQYDAKTVSRDISRSAKIKGKTTIRDSSRDISRDSSRDNNRDSS